MTKEYYIDQRGEIVTLTYVFANNVCSYCMYYDNKGWDSCVKKIPVEHIDAEFCADERRYYERADSE